MTKRALLVGCNYPGTKCELKGCANDVNRMRRMLVERCGFHNDEILVLVDNDPRSRQPTGANIRYCLGNLIRGVRPGDILYFHFSGHGTQVPLEIGEVDDTGYDECIVPTDFNLLTDDDFRALVNRIPQGVTFTFVADSCHSGGLIDHEKEQIGGGPAPAVSRPSFFSGSRPEQSGGDTGGGLMGLIAQGLQEYEKAEGKSKWGGASPGISRPSPLSGPRPEQSGGDTGGGLMGFVAQGLQAYGEKSKHGGLIGKLAKGLGSVLTDRTQERDHGNPERDNGGNNQRAYVNPERAYGRQDGRDVYSDGQIGGDHARSFSSEEGGYNSVQERAPYDRNEERGYLSPGRGHGHYDGREEEGLDPRVRNAERREFTRTPFEFERRAKGYYDTGSAHPIQEQSGYGGIEQSGGVYNQPQESDGSLTKRPQGQYGGVKAGGALYEPSGHGTYEASGSGYNYPPEYDGRTKRPEGYHGWMDPGDAHPLHEPSGYGRDNVSSGGYNQHHEYDQTKRPEANYDESGPWTTPPPNAPSGSQGYAEGGSGYNQPTKVDGGNYQDRVKIKSLDIATLTEILSQRVGHKVQLGNIRTTIFDIFGDQASPMVKTFVSIIVNKLQEEGGGGSLGTIGSLAATFLKLKLSAQNVDSSNYLSPAAGGGRLPTASQATFAGYNPPQQWQVPNDVGILISACEPAERSADANPIGDPHFAYGALTNAIQTIVGESRAPVTNRQLVLAARELLRSQGYKQHPCLYSSNKNADALFIC